MPALIRRPEERFHTRLGWLDSHHCFNFGSHYRHGENGHGLLLVLNDDVVIAGGGFGTHSHRDMEIVTWVLEGSLVHRDSEGNEGTITPGVIQRMSAGTGIRHSEMNASRDEPVHFLQMWVVPDTTGLSPGYEQRDVTDLLAAGGLVTIASGRDHDGAIGFGQSGASMGVASMTEGTSVALPRSPYVFVYVTTGSVRWRGEDLAAGSQLRLVGGAAEEIMATRPSDVVVWDSDAELATRR